MLVAVSLPVSAQPQAAAQRADRSCCGSGAGGYALRVTTTLRAPVSLALAKTSYAFMKSSRSNW